MKQVRCDTEGSGEDRGALENMALFMRGGCYLAPVKVTMRECEPVVISSDFPREWRKLDFFP
jgi:hypothetical protein